MITIPETFDVAAAREELLDAERGYVLIPGLLNLDACDQYRRECEAFLEVGPVLHTRVNTDAEPDYWQPRSHDRVERTHRIYQFLHNSRSPETDRILTGALELRDEIESAWIHDFEYDLERKQLQDYIIVTRYTPGTGYLPRHKDYFGDLAYPLLQFLVLLSEPGPDFEGGEFVLERPDGKEVRIIEDLGIRKGDALLFDKSLYHTVETTEPGTAEGVGRWTVLIGARAKRDSVWTATLRRVMFHPRLFPLTRALLGR